MNGGYEYIKQNFPGYQYSQVKFLQSAVVEGESVIAVNYRKENAEGVLLTGLQCTKIGSEDQFFTITDGQGNALFSAFTEGGYNQKQPYSYYIKHRGVATFICDNPNVSFIAEVQYLSFPEKGDIID